MLYKILRMSVLGKLTGNNVKRNVIRLSYVMNNWIVMNKCDNDLQKNIRSKFVMTSKLLWFIQGTFAFVQAKGLLWSHFEVRTVLASVEVIWPWIEQKWNIASKSFSHAKLGAVIDWLVIGMTWNNLPLALFYT